MSGYGQGHGGGHDAGGNVLVYMFVAVLLLIGVGLFYSKNAEPINSGIIYFCKAQLGLLKHLPFGWGKEPGYLCQKLSQTHPASFSFSQMCSLVTYVGGFARWIAVPFFLCLAIWGWASDFAVSDYYRRLFTMQSLVEHNVDEFPCMAPIANRKRSILEEPMDEGLWATARQPLQWAQHHRLITDKKGRVVKKEHLIDKSGLSNILSIFLEKNNNKRLKLDKEKAEKLFMDQMGPAFEGVDALLDHHKGLAAAFVAFGAGDKDSAQDLLDQMSLSFVEPEEEGGPFKIDIKGADELIATYGADPLLEHYTQNHTSFAYTYLMALYHDFARRKGILPSAEFIWLRPADRTLWYSLNQMGGREAWIESAGPWEHFHTEKIAGRAFSKPQIKNAVAGLEIALIQKGWLAPRKKGGYNV